MATLKTLAIIGLLAILVGIASAVYFFGGYYNVAGTAEEPAIVKWALVKVRQASVAQHAKDSPPTSLDNPATVQAGARAFSERAANFHAPINEYKNANERNKIQQDKSRRNAGGPMQGNELQEREPD
jgi:hypothetical protein